MTSIPSTSLVSVVVPLANNASTLRSYITRLSNVMCLKFSFHEIVLVDDDSTDETRDIALSLLEQIPGLRWIQLARSMGTEVAICAGLETVIGDYVAVALPGVDPPELLPEILERSAREGAIVMGKVKGRGAWWRSFLQRSFSRACRRFFGLELFEGTTFLMALSRPVVNGVNQIKDRFRYQKAFSAFNHYPVLFQDYQPESEDRNRVRGIYESLNSSIDSLVSNSTRPLRLVSLLGLSVGGMNLFYISYIFLIALLKHRVAEGWVTLSSQHALTFFVMSMVLATLAEYLRRVLLESRELPFFFVIEEKTSSKLILGRENTNVVTAATC